jgi:hypothetical protein
MIILARWTDTNGQQHSLQLSPGADRSQIERTFDGIASPITFTRVYLDSGFAV